MGPAGDLRDLGSMREFAAELSQSAAELEANLGAAAQPSAPVGDLAAPQRPCEDPFAAIPSENYAGNLDLIMRIPVSLKIVLGQATMAVADLSRLGRGAIIELDRKVGEPVDVVVNGRLVARGEVVVTDDATGRFGISITEVVNLTSARAPR